MSDLHKILKRGDRRSVGEVSAAIDVVQAGPDRLGDLVRCLDRPDVIVRMRCADALEKLTRSSSDLLQPIAEALLDAAESTVQIEVGWHMAQLLPRLKPAGRERSRHGLLSVPRGLEPICPGGVLHQMENH